MISKLILALFPQGQRKVVVSLIALALGIVMEKFAGGLSENMMTALIAVVGIFTGGNVLEHLSGVLKGLKGTKLGQTIEDLIPGDQGLGKAESVAISAASAPAQGADLEALYGGVDEAHNKIAGVEKQLALQDQSLKNMAGTMNKIIQMIQGAQPRSAGSQGGQNG
jgi:hypothetical protein